MHQDLISRPPLCPQSSAQCQTHIRFLHWRLAPEPRTFSASPAPPAGYSPRAPPPHLRICLAVEPSLSPLLGPPSGPAPGRAVAAAATVAGEEAEDSGAEAGAEAGTWAQVMVPWPSRTRPERTGLHLLPLRALGSFPEPLPGLHTCLGVTRKTASTPLPAPPRQLPPLAVSAGPQSRPGPAVYAANGLFGVCLLANGRTIFFRPPPMR